MPSKGTAALVQVLDVLDSLCFPKIYDRERVYEFLVVVLSTHNVESAPHDSRAVEPAWGEARNALVVRADLPVLRS